MELTYVLGPNINHKHVSHGKREKSGRALKLLPIGIGALGRISALDVIDEDVVRFSVRDPNSLCGLSLSSLNGLECGKVGLKQAVEQRALSTRLPANNGNSSVVGSLGGEAAFSQVVLNGSKRLPLHSYLYSRLSSIA